MTTLTVVQIHLGMQQNQKTCLDVPHLALFWMQNDGTDHPRYQKKHFFQQHAILLSECLYEGVSTNNGTPKSSVLIGFSIINHPFCFFSPYFWIDIHMKCMTSNFRLWDSCHTRYSWHRLQSACPLLATQEPTDVVTGGMVVFPFFDSPGSWEVSLFKAPTIFRILQGRKLHFIRIDKVHISSFTLGDVSRLKLMASVSCD